MNLSEQAIWNWEELVILHTLSLLPLRRCHDKLIFSTEVLWFISQQTSAVNGLHPFKKKNLLLPWLVSYKNSEFSYVIIWSVYTGRTFLSGPICWHLAPLLLENQRLSSAWFLTHLRECQKCVSKKLLCDKWTVSYTRCHQLYTTTSFLEGFEQFTHSRVRPFRGFIPKCRAQILLVFVNLLSIMYCNNVLIIWTADSTIRSWRLSQCQFKVSVLIFTFLPTIIVFLKTKKYKILFLHWTWMGVRAVRA